MRCASAASPTKLLRAPTATPRPTAAPAAPIVRAEPNVLPRPVALPRTRSSTPLASSRALMIIASSAAVAMLTLRFLCYFAFGLHDEQHVLVDSNRQPLVFLKRQLPTVHHEEITELSRPVWIGS